MTPISERDSLISQEDSPAIAPMDYWAERVESLKAGTLGAIATVLAYGLLLGLNQVLARRWLWLTGLQTLDRGLPTLIGAAISLLSGFLFAVTYRYIIRQDPNHHLKSGAVAAFGLVRGLAQLDIGLQTQVAPPTLVMMVLESLLLFAIAQIVLDWAIGRKWIKSFR